MFNSNGLSKDILPARLLPRSDELLSSWIVRLAMAHGLKLHTFCTLLWGKQAIWNRDIDKCADDRLLRELEHRTGTSLERVRAMTLIGYEGTLYERHNAWGNTSWIMPLGMYHRIRLKHGIQYCPTCLAEDKTPYFRRVWRLAFVTVCAKHRCLLFDACPHCDAPINFHRDELGERSKQVATGMARCFVCRFDLRAVCNLVPQDDYDYSIEYQSSLMQAIENRWMDIGGGLKVHSLLYFPVLRQLMKVCASNRGNSLLTGLCRETGIPTLAPLFPVGKTDIESLRVLQRHQLKGLVAYLLRDWPRRFIRICAEGHVWSSTLLRDFKAAPFWYWSVIHDYLYRSSYYAADAEVKSAIAHITNSGGIAYQKAISELLGTQNVFRKRKTFTNFSRATIGRSTVKVARSK